MSNRPRRLASIQVGAALVDVHPRTIRRRIADGTITGYRVGKLIKIDLDEVESRLLRIIPARERPGQVG